MTHDFPTIREVIIMHDALISAFGGIPGIRDEGALEQIWPCLMSISSRLECAYSCLTTAISPT